MRLNPEDIEFIIDRIEKIYDVRSIMLENNIRDVFAEKKRKVKKSKKIVN